MSGSLSIRAGSAMEWKKVLRKRNMVCLLLGLFLLQLFFFLYSIQNRDAQQLGQYDRVEAERQEEEERTAYVDGFHESMEAIGQQADSMSGISIFARRDSFSERNLQQTKKDFEGMLSVQPVLFDCGFLEEYFSYKLLNGITVLCAAVVAFIFVDENKPGLRSMIFASVNGRGRLVAERIGALLLWNGILALLFYGGTLLIGSAVMHGELFSCLGYPIQSIPMFGNLPWKLGIGEFLLCYLIYRWVLLFLITLAVWTLLYSIDHVVVAFGAAGLIGMAEYLLVRLVDGNSPVNALRYCNLWYLTVGVDFFTEYKNLNIFSYAVNKNVLIYGTGLIFCVLFLTFAFFTGIRRYPNASAMGRLKRRLHLILRRLRYLVGTFQERISLRGAEYYKVLISQKGIVILLVILAAAVSQTDTTGVQRSAAQRLYQEFMERHEGVPDAESLVELKALDEELAVVQEAYEEDERKYRQGELSETDWYYSCLRYEAFDGDRQFLEQVQEVTSYLQTLEQERGIKGWYLNTSGYLHLLEDGSSLLYVLLVLSIVLLCSGSFSYEEKCGTRAILRSSAQGRAALYRRKMKTVLFLTLVLYLIMCALEIGSIAHVYGISGLQAPVQSVMRLSFVQLRCSVGAFFGILYLIRGVMLVSVAAFTCMLSVRTSQKYTIALSCVLCVPEVLSLVGIEWFQYLSVLQLVSVIPFLMRIRKVAVVAAVSLGFMLLGIFWMRSSYRKWCIT